MVVEKIEYISEEVASTQIINVENPKYALITYKKYINSVGERKKIPLFSLR